MPREERNKWGRRTSCNPFLCPEYGRGGLETKVFNSLLPWRVSPLSLPETPPCVCECVHVCVSVCVCVCVCVPQVVVWVGSSQGKVSTQAGLLTFLTFPVHSFSLSFPLPALSTVSSPPLLSVYQVCSCNEEYLRF